VDEARGLARGSEVWLAGQKIGLVEGIRFLPPSADTGRRLLLTLDVLTAYQPYIRRDATVQIRAGGTLIGSPVAWLTNGTAAAPMVHPGDTLHTIPQNDFEAISSRVSIASRDLPPIIANLKLLASQLQSARGTLGALGIEKGGATVDETQQRLSSIVGQVRSPRGTIGRALDERTGLAARARHALADVDSVRALLASDRYALGRFRRDSSLLAQVGAVRDEITIVRARLASPQGTVGRVTRDSALVRGLLEAEREMSGLFTDVKQHPFRYVRP
jgi:ABC-type transporter Mla subunit MlaD